MLAEKLDKQPMLGDDLSLSSVGDSPEVSRLTYHGGTTPLVSGIPTFHLSQREILNFFFSC